MIFPIIIAGGSGSRLWPLSRSLYPKQFLPLIDDTTMIQDTLKRLKDIEHADPIIICNEEHRFIVAEQLRQENIKHNGIILEPIGRNTAPAVALGAQRAISITKDPVILVLAADHSIQDIEEFSRTIIRAHQQALDGKLVTFGTIPLAPETGYGYIKKGESYSDDAFYVDEFVEKPNLELAQKYLDSKDYLWNSGMFMFKAEVYLAELEKYSPRITSACLNAYKNAQCDLEFVRIRQDDFIECPDDSVDYAVMEHTENAVVVPLDAKWSDVGSWSSLWDISDKDSNGNSVKGDALLVKTSDSFIYSNSRLVTSVGLKNIIIVETKDAVLVADKDNVQDVKLLVNELKSLGRKEYIEHQQCFRPWGQHESIASGARFHVKHVVVKPGEKISKQVHFHRAEHWIVVAGTAKVTKDNTTFVLAENQSTFIPIGTPHTLENPGKIPLEVIEIQSGSYLNDDDILRIISDGEYGNE
ncbi:mannose-1-phosphate guanylyltransferase/mannose-6-phosphate isomerase [Lelliottia sp. JS-SCA-14]|uniref:mannose-1-phosphate guanylyltransferase/mannose-6-phosphate isomerase n=1 Tax=Lelliottia sp. JS-SCA-14 TaxID=3110110 RepID=UPI002D7688C6|nr:mannose-1-phosphate guanylyltransferase/mannose-6-phosphate isomerase [Lelliottia sp. JS-SCA-14]